MNQHHIGPIDLARSIRETPDFICRPQSRLCVYEEVGSVPNGLRDEPN
jgi:hypothetical protein